MQDKYADETSKHFYPGTETLINKFGIKDGTELYKVERELVMYRIAELYHHPIKGAFDLKHLQAIHYYLFQDIYDWAGIIRDCNIAKQETVFCLAEFIPNYAESIFGELANDNYYINDDYEIKIYKLAKFFSDVNALHPFREGNGRSQRIFIEWLSKISGIEVDLTKINKDEMCEASQYGMMCRYEKLIEIFKKNSYLLNKKEHLESVQLLLKSNNKKQTIELIKKEHQKVLKL